jgi:hypothetical protein
MSNIAGKAPKDLCLTFIAPSGNDFHYGHIIYSICCCAS